MDTADTAVRGFDPVAAPHLDLAQRNTVIGDGLREPCRPEIHAARQSRPGVEAVVGPGDHLLGPVSRVSGLPGTNWVSSAGLSWSKASSVQRSRTSGDAASTRSTGTSRARPARCFGSTTRWVTALRTGSTTTRVNSPHTPSVQRASVPIVNCVVSDTLSLRHLRLDRIAVQCPATHSRHLRDGVEATSRKDVGRGRRRCGSVRRRHLPGA